MSQNDHNRDMEIFKIACEHYRQDLRECWSRTSMYLLAQAFLFAAFAAVVARSRAVGNLEVAPHVHDIVFEIILGVIGVFISLFSFFVTYGSQKWVDRWRDRVKEIDTYVDPFQCYVKAEGFDDPKQSSYEPSWWKRMYLKSPGFVTPAISLILCVGWLSMTLVVFFAWFGLLRLG